MTQEDRDMLIEIHTNVKSLNKIMFDNGQPGLLTRFNQVEVSHKECQKRQDGVTGKTSNYIAIGALLVATLSPLILHLVNRL